MQRQDIDTWKKKLDWIAEKGGMVLINTHPDYMVFDRRTRAVEEFPAEITASIWSM